MNADLNYAAGKERAADLMHDAQRARLVRDARAIESAGARGVVVARFFIFLRRGATRSQTGVSVERQRPAPNVDPLVTGSKVSHKQLRNCADTPVR
jgi:hypothetical protein